MKIKAVFTILFYFISTLAVKPQKQVVFISHYLFPSFTTGKIKFRTGVTNEIMLNYNSLTEEMIFETNGRNLALANPESVDTIYLGGKKFIPSGKIFYEVPEDLPVSLFIRHLCRVIPPGKPSGYGGVSETAAITESSSLYTSGGVYNLKLPDDYKIIPYSEFVLKKDNEYIKVFNVNQVIKCFPEKKDAIKEFVKAHKTNFKNEDELKSLIEFCNK